MPYTDTELLFRANNIIAQGALTNSKRASCFVGGVYPTHLKSGNGCYVLDTLNHRYIDFICGLGSTLLGHGNPEIAKVIYEAALSGLALSLGSDLEVRVAEKLKEYFRWIDRVKFLKTGTEATAAAIRIARAHTGKKMILSDGYHGWSDEFVSLTPPAHGVHKSDNLRAFKSFIQLEYNTDIAAVIIEPVMTDASEERKQYLKTLRELCTKKNIVLIFDEVITGFRFPQYSVSNHWDIEPDLMCLGKALGGGMPLAAVVGKKEIMETKNEYFVSSTFAGERGSLAASLKFLELIKLKHPIAHVWERGQRFLDQFNSLWPEKLTIEGYPTRGVFKGDDMVKALFWQESVKAGIMFGPSWFIGHSHLDILDSVIGSSRDILTRIKTGAVKLEGLLPTKPFAQQQRELSK